MEAVRAVTAAQRAGAYYVRIHAMAVKHHIPLEMEIDHHDETDAKHVIVLDDVLPVATGRIFPAADGAAQMGRIVVLPEYRRKGLGTMVVKALEAWAAEMGYEKIILEARENKTAFYESMGYAGDKSKTIYSEPFTCVYMEKYL
ncbi:MAG: GNAT family N-acetyltransferase [Bacillota bacterium]|nr:GNAT family N-acetyltransferase [Bacillota bacterium]